MADENIKNNTGDEYGEAFKLRAVAIAHARTWSNKAIAATLSIPADLFEDWIEEYSDKVEVCYVKDKHIKSKQVKEKLEKCPKCGAAVIFEHIKSFEVQRVEGVDIGTHDSIMNSGDDGIFGIKVPYVRITTERINRCPACGVYVIQNIFEKLTKSEV